MRVQPPLKVVLNRSVLAALYRTPFKYLGSQLTSDRDNVAAFIKIIR